MARRARSVSESGYMHIVVRGIGKQILFEDKHDDEWAKEELKKCLSISSGTVLQKYCRIDRDTALSRLKERELSIRQIERLTGINRNTTMNINKSEEIHGRAVSNIDGRPG